LLWKFAGKSLLGLRQFEKAQQCLSKAHKLNNQDPEVIRDIGNIFLNLGQVKEASAWYKKSLEINKNYAPAINNLASIKRQHGNHKGAAILYKQAIEADPQLVQAYLGAATCLLTVGDLVQAQAIATQAIAINENFAGINEILGIIFYKKKKHQQAIQWYQKEIKINPQSKTSLLNLGLLLLEQGKAAAAIEPLTAAAALEPSEKCSLLLAQAYQNTGKPKEAISEYEKIDYKKTKNKLIPFNLGLCLLKIGRNVDAIMAFNLVTKMDESFVPAWGNIGTALMNEGKHQEAIQATQKVLEINPDNPDAHMNLGCIYKNLGNFDKALASTLKSLELKPDNPGAYMNLVGIYKNLGNFDKALASTLKSLELKPDNPDAHMNLGGIYKNLGNLDKALASTLKSLELKPDNPDAHMNLGGIYKNLGNLDKALASTLKSLELKPDNPDAHMNLGSIYKDLGNLDKALASTLKSLELKPDNFTAHINLGGIYKDLGNLDKALASTLKFLELRPDNTDALVNLGCIYKDLERIEDAKIAFNKALNSTTRDTQSLTAILDFYDSINEEELLERMIAQAKKGLSDSSLRVKIYEARALFRQQKYKESWKILPTTDSASKELKDWFSISKYHKFRGEIAEKNDYFDEAYFSFEAAQIDPLYKTINHKKEYSRIEQYMTLSKKMSKDRAKIDAIHDIRKDADPVFLIGFPRSGTTLLDTVLRSHPGIEVLEEKDPLAVAEKSGISDLHVEISDFNLLKEEQLSMLRESYLARLKLHSKNIDKLIVDKLPLHTIAIPLINLLFPNAKIIFALRHPCDSILSCFQQTFKPNIAMANFTNLERSVDFYGKVMHGWTTYNESLKINYTVSKYEDLVYDFDESVSNVLNHLNLPWDDGVRDYRSTAMKRASIKTPSSSQVVQPLYKSSIGRWKNYQNHFSKHMGKLNTWINYFDYKE
jgi:tetratricopeptide (TPR) repeat protein